MQSLIICLILSYNLSSVQQYNKAVIVNTECKDKNTKQIRIGYQLFMTATEVLIPKEASKEIRSSQMRESPKFAD